MAISIAGRKFIATLSGTARRARAAAGLAGGRVRFWRVGLCRLALYGRVPQRPQRNRPSEGQNVTVEYHWLEGHYDRLPALMADLVRRQVAVIATDGLHDP